MPRQAILFLIDTQGANTVGSSNFGQTTIQAGFMRITQLMVRFSF